MSKRYRPTKEKTEKQIETERKSRSKFIIALIAIFALALTLLILYGNINSSKGLEAFFADIGKNISDWWEDFTFKNDKFFRFFSSILK